MAGKVAVTWLGPEPRVIVSDPNLMREILANKRGQIGKQRSAAWIERLLANGLTAHQGEKWVVHRRIISHAFHLDKLKRMVPAFTACCSELIRRWHDSVVSGHVEEIDVWPEFQNLTGDVISRAAFGSSFSEGRRIFQLQSEQAKNAVKMVNVNYIPGYRSGHMSLSKYVLKRVNVWDRKGLSEIHSVLQPNIKNTKISRVRDEPEGHPFHLSSTSLISKESMCDALFSLRRYLPTKLNRQMKANAREVEELLKGVISKREKQAMEEDGLVAKNDDLLGLLLEANLKESQESGSSKPMMTTQDIIGELKLFYFAGMETTAVLLTWTMVVLSMHPEWQDRAREEVLRVFGKNHPPDSEGTNQLRIVPMVLHEVLRLYPPILLVGRETYQEAELGGVRYPPGVTFALPIVCVHHDPDVWGEDADEFRPDRFAEGVSKASKKDAPAFFPFGWGPKICVGQNFALLEAKIGLSIILQHFAFELSPSYSHAPCAVSTLQPQHGAQIKLKTL